jgi:hypothetical protein
MHIRKNTYPNLKPAYLRTISGGRRLAADGFLGGRMSGDRWDSLPQKNAHRVACTVGVQVKSTLENRFQHEHADRPLPMILH